MISGFADKGTEDLWNGVDSRAARASCPKQLWQVAWRKLDMVNAATSLLDLKVPPANRLEKLAGKHAGKHSIRINDQYRVVFRWENNSAHEVWVGDYH